MEDRSTWVPMRWPDDWRDPSLLDLLKDTPINCLVVKWGNERPAAELLVRGRQLGLAFVGLIEGADGRAAALQAAQTAGLAAVALDNPSESKLPAFGWAEKSKLPWGSDSAGLAFTDGVWPAIPPMKTGEGGPTGAPWVDSNGWFIQLARTRAPGKPVWVSVAPPKSNFVRTSQYLLAVSDAAAYGARWVVTLDEKLRAALAERKQAALDMWKNITGAMRFFEAHRDWERLAPYSALAVISDFSGPNEFGSHELLNLLPRRGAPYRIIEKSRAAGATLDGIKGIIYPDGQPPADDLKKKLVAFAEAGGVLVASAKWPAPAGVQPKSDVYRRWNVYPAGKGRIAIAKEESPDPYLVAADAQILISHRNDVVRYFNFATLNGHCTASPDGRKAVLHAINYAMRTWGHPVSIAFTQRYKAARMWRFDADSPSALQVVPGESGVEVHLPPFGVYAAIELDA